MALRAKTEVSQRRRNSLLRLYCRNPIWIFSLPTPVLQIANLPATVIVSASSLQQISLSLSLSAHVITKGQIPHDMSSVRWRVRKASGVFQIVPVWIPENQGSWWYNSQSKDKGLRSRIWGAGGAGTSPGVQKLLWCLKGGEDWCPNSRRERIHPFSTFLVYLGRPSMGGMMPAHISEGGSSLLSVLIQIQIPPKNTFKNTPRNNAFSAT